MGAHWDWHHILLALACAPVWATSPAQHHGRAPFDLFLGKVGRIVFLFFFFWESMMLCFWIWASHMRDNPSPAYDCGFREILRCTLIRKKERKWWKIFKGKMGVEIQWKSFQKSLGRMLPQASEDAYWVSSANHCRTKLLPLFPPSVEGKE